MLSWRQRTAQVAAGIAQRPSGCDRIADTCPQFWCTRCAVSSAPRPSIRRSAASTSGALISAIARPPSQGNTSFSRRWMIFPECESAQFGECLANHSLAITSKLFGARSVRAAFLALRVAPGSMLLASCVRSSSRRSRASFKLRIDSQATVFSAYRRNDT